MTTRTRRTRAKSTAAAKQAGETGHARGFPPIARADARVLILGTMPSKASLAAGQYYAHPRNAFWRILGSLLGFDADAPYDARAAHLRAARIALWDVLLSCRRPGSLDSDIDPDTIIANDFAAFFAAHPHIHTVYFNGGNAERLYRRHVAGAARGSAPMRTVRLPSTSPAHAGRSFADKLRAWRVIER